jgi:hypothetical protein
VDALAQRRREALTYFLNAICLPHPAVANGGAGLGMHAGPDLLLRSFHHVAMLLEEVSKRNDSVQYARAKNAGAQGANTGG